MVSKLKKAVSLLAKIFKDYLTNKGFNMRVVYTRYLERAKIRDNIILYESYHGRNISCSPLAIFKYLHNDPKYRDFIHIWAVNDINNESVNYFKNYKNVKFVEIHSKAYLKALATAKYLINNTSFPYYFQKREGQIYINTWHGTPIKAMGKDVKNAPFADHKNIQRNFLHADYLIFPNQYTLDKMVNSYDIKGIFEGALLDIGYPRVDLMFKTEKKEIREILGVPEGKKVILFAPTWRGKVHQEEDTSEKLLSEFEQIKQNVPKNYIVLLKSHYFVQKFFQKKGFGHVVVPSWVDTNELLSIVDILITDYSSIMFDFFVTRNPVIFYTPDYEEYSSERGLYLNYNDLPGPRCNNIQEVIDSIKNIDSLKFKYHHMYETVINKYCYNDDGNASKRLVEIVFENQHSHLKKFINEKNKTKLLMYCGGFYNNGITVSAINLLNKIDYDKFDVTLLDFDKKTEDALENIKKINPNVKIVYRFGDWNMTLMEAFAHNVVIRKGLYKQIVKKIAPEKMYRRELRRIIGNSKFDIAIDFGGYNRFWTTLFAFGGFKKKVVYQHNDMMKEFNKKVNGKYKHRDNLRVIFSLYMYFDKIVSVAKSTRDENFKNLKTLVPLDPKRMVYVNNLIDYDRILGLRDEVETIDYNGKSFYLITNENQNRNGVLSIKCIEIPNKDNINFITIGRLSPEKDHKKLINAFARLTKLRDNLKLYIVGEGVLEKELIKLTENLGIKDKVIFTGQLSNPFLLLNKCDCFVLSSNYEGQGLVLLEALVLGKPIIATDVTGVRSVLEGGYGMLIGNSEEALYTAMYQFVTDGINTKKFDYVDYNKRALDMFYEEVCSLSDTQ